MSRVSCAPPTAIPASITLQLCPLGREDPRQKLKQETWVGFLLLPNYSGAHLPDFYAFRLPSSWSQSSLFKVFFIPYSMSWQLFPSQQPGQVFLLLFMLKMTALLSQHARSPRLSGNTWHCSRRHFFFQEFNRSWVLIIQGLNPSKCFPHLHFLSVLHYSNHHAEHHKVTTVTHTSHYLGKNSEHLAYFYKNINHNMLRTKQQGLLFLEHLKTLLDLTMRGWAQTLMDQIQSTETQHSTWNAKIL